MKLSQFLPPFASDYSGAASVLFGSGAQLLIVDPGCCTYSYVDVEESRWPQGGLAVLSAQLRTDDTVLGADELLLEQLSQIAEKTQPPKIAVLGTPVPALVGMDIEGLALEAQERCGVPVVGIDTNGFETYDKGIKRAYKVALRVAENQNQRGDAQNDSRNRVALLGFSPFDLESQSEYDKLKASLEGQGITCVAPFGAGCSGDGDITCAQLSIVGSQAGLECARKLQARYGIPFAIWSPYGQHDPQTVDDWLALAQDPYQALDVQEPEGQPIQILVIGEQLRAHSLARRLQGECPCIRPTTASFFADALASRRLDTVCLEDEGALAALLVSRRFDVIIADPLFLRLPEAKGVPVAFSWPHRAVSGSLYLDEELAPEGKAHADGGEEASPQQMRPDEAEDAAHAAGGEEVSPQQDFASYVVGELKRCFPFST
ncbi:hypothetical protein HLV35_05350 [Eggerthellaceae bacterium zg-997]|nr:hypothetical protein [Eggerthellaceae bacterium zg-997]